MKNRNSQQTDCKNLIDVAEQIVALFSDDRTELDVKEIRDELIAILQEFTSYQSATNQEKLTPPQLAKIWGIGPDKVLAWIRKGELKATNVATISGGRPRYLIDKADLRDFEQGRVSALRPRSKSRKRLPSKVTEFF